MMTFRQILSAVLLSSLLLAAVPAGVAFATCDDGTAANDNIICDVNPPVGDADIGLGLGDDTYVQNNGILTDYVGGDALPNGDINIGDGGSDTITISGVALVVTGDSTDDDGGDDVILITSTGVTVTVQGDDSDDDGGDDLITLDGFAVQVAGDAVGGDGGNDVITINDAAFEVMGDDAVGNGGNDIITIAGNSSRVYGDETTGDGGDDVIIVTSTGGVTNFIWGDSTDGNGGDDVIIVNGTAGIVDGDNALGNGGNDIIVINGEAVIVYGDDVLGIGGNDTIYVYGTITFNVEADDGDDTVILGADAEVGLFIDGEGGTDTLAFEALRQSELDALGLDPAGDTLTINGHTYDWLNFESLVGLLAELAERGLRVFFASDSLLAVESEDHLGINVFAEHGRIAFISFENADGLGVGETATYATPNAAGWYVTVTNLGGSADHPGHSLYQVNIYNAAGGFAGQFTFVN